MTLNFKLFAAGLGILSLLSGGWYIRGLIADRDKARSEILLAAIEIEGLKYEIAENRRALEERRLEIDRLSAETQALAAKLREVYANDSEAYKWSNCELPDSVACLLR